MSELTDLQKDKLRKFADDEVMLNAVAGIIIGSMPPFIYRSDMPNTLIGEMIRSQQIAAEYIKGGFRKLQTEYKTQSPKKGDKSNPAV